MEYQVLSCPDCGQTKIEQHNDKYHCVYCGCTFTQNYAKQALLDLQENLKRHAVGAMDNALRKQAETKFYNLRNNLWECVHAEYIDSEAIIAICNQIKSLVPNDFPANFYLVPTAATSRRSYASSIKSTSFNRKSTSNEYWNLCSKV